MALNGLIWVVDDHRLRRDGTVGFLYTWAKDNLVELHAVDQPGHIFPAELPVSENCKHQLCVLGIGGGSFRDRAVVDDIATLFDVLGDRPLVVICDATDKDEIEIARTMGISGVILTSNPAEIAFATIEFIISGGSYFPKTTAGNCIDIPNGARADTNALRHAPMEVGTEEKRSRISDYAQPSTERAPKAPPELTRRQTEVLRALQRGQSNKVIARALDVSEATVKIHVRHLMQKFGADNRTQVALSSTLLIGN